MSIDQFLNTEDINDDPIEQSNEETTEEQIEETTSPEGILESPEQSSEEREEEPEVNPEGDTQEGESQGPQKEVEKHKLNIGGTEYELTVDELKQFANKAAGADEKFREASMLSEQAKNMMYKLKEDPFYVLEKLGIDVNKVVNDRVAGMLDYEMLSEDKKTIHDYKLQLGKMDKEKANDDEYKKRQDHEARIQQEKSSYLTSITEAINKTPMLKENEFTVSQMARYMQQFKKAGVEPPMEKIADKVLTDYKNQMSLFMSKMSPEDRHQFLGEDNVRSISSQYGKSINKNNYTTSDPLRTVIKKEPKKGITQSEMNEYLAGFTQ